MRRKPEAYGRTSAKSIMDELKGMANPRNVEGMARFGINPQNTLGVSVTDLRRMAKRIGKDHSLAQELWSSGIHEARILASLVDDPELVTEAQMDGWAKDFDSWDVCDVCCNSLFGYTPFAWKKAREWPKSEMEFVKRAGFVMMAVLAVHDKKAADREFEKLLPSIAKASDDDRNFVKKAVNWALRQVGKRNVALNRKAVATAKALMGKESRSARWIGSDALRELSSDATLKRLRARDGPRG
ncbi:MAG: DNA alkylation repair protein [Euryarchaeota archaeon RBG_16_62_10]|nr:MAG: DNA alkylation repair protein [Euryarchaeota archaeon RBG_16_62_10]